MKVSIPRNVSICLFACSTLGFLPGTADAARGVSSTRAAAIEDVIQNAPYGTPSYLGGVFRMHAPANDPVAVTFEFLRSQSSRIGITDPDNELEVTDILGPDDLGMTHVRLQHQAMGLPVFGSEMIVHMKGNVVTSMNGVYLRSFHPRLNVAVEGDIASDTAIDYVMDLIDRGEIDGLVAYRDQALELDAGPELGFFNRGLLSDETTPTHLAWKVSVNGYVVFVSARDNRVLESYDTVHSAMNREIYDVNNGTSLPGQLVCREGQACTTTDSDAKKAWNEFEEIYDYFYGTHGRDSWDGKGSKMIGSVHYSQNFVNAYWSGSQMVFGDNMVALDVTGHELGHGVCQTTANLTYKYQPGALNESLSDVWGVMIDDEDWLVGEDLPIGAIRSMSNPNTYNQPKDMSEYKKYFLYDNGGVHINSGIPNYAAYLLAAGGSNQGVTVRAEGRGVVETIWYRTEVTKLTSSSKFADFANLAIKACEELYGRGSDECTQADAAFRATLIL